MVFDEAAADGHEGAEIACDLVLGSLHVAWKELTDEAQSDGVVQDGGTVDDLVGSAAEGHAKGSFAGSTRLHWLQFK